MIAFPKCAHSGAPRIWTLPSRRALSRPPQHSVPGAGRDGSFRAVKSGRSGSPDRVRFEQDGVRSDQTHRTGAAEGPPGWTGSLDRRSARRESFFKKLLRDRGCALFELQTQRLGLQKRPEKRFGAKESADRTGAIADRGSGRGRRPNSSKKVEQKKKKTSKKRPRTKKKNLNFI